MDFLRNAFNAIQVTRLWGLYLLVLVMAFVGLGLGTWYAWNAADLVRNGTRVDARVSSVRAAHDDDSRFEPTYEYRIDGESYFYEQTNPTVKPRPRIGERRELVVDPDDPHDVTTPDFFGFWATPIVLLTFGALCCFALWYRLVFQRRRRG